MDDGFFFSALVATRGTPQLVRTPALSRSRRNASTSSASTTSTSASPTLVTPRHTSITRPHVRPPPLNLKACHRPTVDDVFVVEDSDLVKVLNLTPRSQDATFSPFPFCDSPISDRHESARPDTSPLLSPLDEWKLPLVPRYGPISMNLEDSPSWLDVSSRPRPTHTGASLEEGVSHHGRESGVDETLADQVETLSEAGPSNHAHRPSNGYSITSSISSASSLRSLRSNLSNPPSIPDRSSSRKRPTLPDRVSSLKPSSSGARTAPPPRSTASRQSICSVVSEISVLDPYPALPSFIHPTTSTPLSPQRRKQLRASSFSLHPLSPILSSPVDFSAIAFTGLEEHERHHLHRTTSAPHLSKRGAASDMPSTPSRYGRRQSANSSCPNVDFSASPPSRPRRPIFALNAFSSPKPSPFAIEHFAEHVDSDKSSQDIVIPLYDAALSPRSCVHLRPVTTSHRTSGASSLAECTKADKMQKLIGLAGMNETMEAIREAETWHWAKPPPREGAVVIFPVVRDQGREIASRHGRQESGGSYMSGESGFGSEMGLSESHSVGSISEAAVITPSASTTFLIVTIPTVEDPVTPTSSYPLLAGTDITPKAPSRAEGLKPLRRSSSQDNLDGASSPRESASRGMLSKKSMTEIRGRGKADVNGSKDSLGRPKAKKDKAWSFMPDMGNMSAMLY